MLRVIVSKEDCAHVVNGGASMTDVQWVTVDIEAPELERLLRTNQQGYLTVRVAGVQVLPTAEESK